MRNFINWLDKKVLELKQLTKICIVKGCSETGEVKDDNDNYLCYGHFDKFSR